MNTAKLIAASKILDKLIEDNPLQPGTWEFKRDAIIVRIENAQVTKGEDYTRGIFSTFKFDLGCAFLLQHVPARQRAAMRNKMFSFLEKLEEQDKKALAFMEELVPTLESFKKYKKQLGDQVCRGKTTVSAFGGVE